MTGVTDRVAWIDIAKALSIILIVVYHATFWLTTYALPDASNALESVIQKMSTALIPVRIPLFFLASGLLARPAINRSWRTLLRTRYSSLLWPFLIWTIIVTPMWALRVDYSQPLSVSATALSALAFGGAHFWFFPALAASLTVGKLMKRWPILTLGIAATVGFWGRTWITPMFDGLNPVLQMNLNRSLTFMFWFLLGCYASSLVFRIAHLPTWTMPVAVAVFAALSYLNRSVEPGLYLNAALGLCGVTALVLVSQQLARSPAAARAGTYLAQRTLAIYVVHAVLFELIAVLSEWLRRRGIAIPSGDSIFGYLFVPLMVVFGVLASISIFGLAKRFGFMWLFVGPKSTQPQFASTPSR